MSLHRLEPYVEEQCRLLEADRPTRTLQLHYRAEWESMQREHRHARRRRLALWLGMQFVHLGNALCRWSARGHEGRRQQPARS